MKKKTQMLIWIIVSVLMLAVVAYLITNIVIAKTKEIQNPVVTLEIAEYGNIKIELYPEYAPNTVLNFINLVKKDFYNGKTFYGKDETGIYTAKSEEGEEVFPTMSLVDSDIEAGSDNDFEYQINGEFIANGYEENTLRHEKGVISMVREEYSSYFGLTEQGYNSGSGNFQIMLDTNRNLNGLYTAFGKVIEGLEIVEAIFSAEELIVEDEDTENSDITELATPAVITKATVETYGVEYEMPEVHSAFDYDAYLQSYFETYYSE